MSPGGLRYAEFACLPSREVLGHLDRGLDPVGLLSPVEAVRASQLTAEDQEDFVAARLLTRLLLRRRFPAGTGRSGIGAFAFTQVCDRCGGPHGPPRVDVPGAAISWAHARGLVAAAVGVGVGAIGVDVDVDVGGGNPGPDGASLRAWVRGEAIVKWGHGTLDEASTWGLALTGRRAPRGRRYVFDPEGRPRPARWGSSRLDGVVVTDGVVVMDGRVGRAAQCAVAAASAARFVNPLG